MSRRSRPRPRWLPPLLVGLAACGFHRAPGGLADAPALDAPPAPDAVPVDAAPLGPWGTPVLLAELSSTANDDDPTLTADLLEIYFGSTRFGGTFDEDILRATRASTGVPFSVPMRVTELSSPSLDSNVEVSGDGLTITFTSMRGGDADIYIATRASRAEPWSAPQLAAGLNAPGAGDWGAVLAPDRLSAVLCSDRGGDEALYTTQRATTGDAWGAPAELADVETSADECDAMLPDPRSLYFTRNPIAGTTNLDLYEARSNGSTFGSAQPLDSLNTLSRDSDPWVAPDQRTIVFSSNRLGGPGFDDLYLATR